MILFVLHDTEKLDDVLDGWDSAGVTGVTVLLSTGLDRVRNRALREDMPILPRLEDFLHHEEDTNRTLFTVVETEELADRVVEVTQNIIGDLNQPRTGILVVMPVARAFGLNRVEEESEDTGG